MIDLDKIEYDIRQARWNDDNESLRVPFLKNCSLLAQIGIGQQLKRIADLMESGISAECGCAENQAEKGLALDHLRRQPIGPVKTRKADRGSDA